MAEVKWIKIATDIFDDDKILLIETLPEADSIIVIWFKLLCLAGKQNNSGVFVLNDKIAYTDKMLATIFRRKESTVQLALQTFEKFGMIEIVDDVITIPNWGKHQNLDKIEAKTEYMRQYMRDYREKQKKIACKTNSKTNSKANVSSADKIREEEDKEKKNSNVPDEAVFYLPAFKDGKAYVVTKGYIEEMRSLYPNVDIDQSFRSMVGWLKANKSKGKTLNGMPRFINNWLQKEQTGDSSTTQTRKPDNRVDWDTIGNEEGGLFDFG